MTILIDKAYLKKIGVNIPQQRIDSLNHAADRFGLNKDKTTLAYWLSNCAHESLMFTKVEESLYYRDPLRLADVYRSFFSATGGGGKRPAGEYLQNSKKVANFVYADRYGNGNEASGDGFKFRGGGYMQLTFSDNYKDFSLAVCKDDTCWKKPELVRDLSTDYPALSAAWFSVERAHILEYAKREDFKALVGAINGPARLGYKDREKMMEALV